MAWKGVTGFHLWWAGPAVAVPVVAVRAVLEVLEAPAVAPTYFWALQASFTGTRGEAHGAAHTGLQSYARFPDGRAVNWGGYAEPPAGGVLAGSAPTLPGFADDPNTRAFAWRPGVPYRFTIARSADGWAATVAAPSAGTSSGTSAGTSSATPLLLRVLHAGGERLTSPVVWAEVFAPCGSPPTTVRWSAFATLGADGIERTVDRVQVSLPADGNCPDTDVVADDVGILLRTGVSRGSVRHGDLLTVPGAGLPPAPPTATW